MIPGTNSIKINGDRVISGATVLSGASIESPSYVGGKLELGLLGALDIAPNTILTLEFNQNDSVKVILTQGCVILNARKNITGEIESPQGVLRKTDLKTGSTLTVCFPDVAPAEVKLHDPELDSGLFDLGKTAAMAIIGSRKGAGIDFVSPGRGSNPGPSTP
jgi:formylmethanofuran dehydrogenase subunit D